jgi:hypothetical protein
MYVFAVTSFRSIRAGSELDGQHPQPEAIKLVILLKRKDRAELQGTHAVSIPLH